MVVLVLTGCTSGLGARVLSELAHRLPPSSTIFTGFRSSITPSTPSGLSANSTVTWIPLDLASLTSVDEFVREIRNRIGEGGGIDCVLLNAATWNNSFRFTKLRTPNEGTVEEEWAEEFVVNHLAQFRLIQGLLPLLSSKNSATTPSSDPRSRIIFTSSSLQNSLSPQISSVDKVLSILRDSTDPLSVARNRYASSKLLQSLSFYHLQRELESSKKEIDVVGVSPGFVPTTGLSRDAPWWQQILMKWVIYYFPFCSTEEQGTRKILECFNYLLPSEPFPSTLHAQLPLPLPASSSSTSRLVFHPASLSPLESKSNSKVYEEVRTLLDGRQRRGEGGDNLPLNELMKKILVQTN